MKMIYSEPPLLRQLSNVVWNMLANKTLHPDVYQDMYARLYAVSDVFIPLHSVVESPEMEFPF